MRRRCLLPGGRGDCAGCRGGGGHGHVGQQPARDPCDGRRRATGGIDHQMPDVASRVREIQQVDEHGHAGGRTAGTPAGCCAVSSPAGRLTTCLPAGRQRGPPTNLRTAVHTATSPFETQSEGVEAEDHGRGTEREDEAPGREQDQGHQHGGLDDHGDDPDGLQRRR